MNKYLKKPIAKNLIRTQVNISMKKHANNEIVDEATGPAARTAKKSTRSTSRQARFDGVMDQVENAKSEAEELRDELQAWLDGIPENLKAGTKADELQSAIEELESVIANLDEAACATPEFPGMFT